MIQYSKRNAFSIVKDFEAALCEYTGSPYAVTVNSCTSALFLALKYHQHNDIKTKVEIPKRTYVSVPMQIKHVGFQVKFRDEYWYGAYQLKPFNIYDAARRFTSNMYFNMHYLPMGENVEKYKDQKCYICVSFHWSKILGIQQGGAILHDDPKFDEWARRARFDGRIEGVPPNKDTFQELGYHCYMSPEIAAEGLVRLMHLPMHNKDLPNDDYPDLSKFKLFSERDNG